MSTLPFAEEIYETMSSWAETLYAIDDTSGYALPLLAIVFVIGTIYAIALRSGQGDKPTSRTSKRLAVRMMAFTVCAAIATLYIATTLQWPSTRQPGQYIHPDKDRPAASIPDLYNTSIRQLQNGLDSGLYTSIDLVDVSHDTQHGSRQIS
jgi:hypothetical protein